MELIGGAVLDRRGKPSNWCLLFLFDQASLNGLFIPHKIISPAIIIIIEYK